jgi:hypothetical protein
MLTQLHPSSQSDRRELVSPDRRRNHKIQEQKTRFESENSALGPVSARLHQSKSRAVTGSRDMNVLPLGWMEHLVESHSQCEAH